MYISTYDYSIISLGQPKIRSLDLDDFGGDKKFPGGYLQTISAGRTCWHISLQTFLISLWYTHTNIQ